MKFVEENGVDLVIMGTLARSGVLGMLIGNTAEEVLDRIQCSVLALKPKGFVSPVRIPDDSSDALATSGIDSKTRETDSRPKH